MGRAGLWQAQVGQRRRGQQSRQESQEWKEKVSQNTKEQTLPGRELMSRSDDNARSSLVFIDFGHMENKDDLGQTVLAEQLVVEA